MKPKKRYETLEEFCSANGFGYEIQRYIQRLNGYEEHYYGKSKSDKQLQYDWKNGSLCVKGIWNWIIDLAQLGAGIAPPTISPDGSAVIFDNRARNKLLKEMNHIYTAIIHTSLRFGQSVDGRLGNSFDRDSIEEMTLNSNKLKLVWALLGYSVSECNLSIHLQTQQYPIVTARLLPLIRAQAEAQHQTNIPLRLVKMKKPKIRPLTSLGRK